MKNNNKEIMYLVVNQQCRVKNRSTQSNIYVQGIPERTYQKENCIYLTILNQTRQFLFHLIEGHSKFCLAEKKFHKYCSNISIFILTQDFRFSKYYQKSWKFCQKHFSIYLLLSILSKRRSKTVII